MPHEGAGFLKIQLYPCGEWRFFHERISSLFGNYSKRELKRIQPICDRVLMKEDTYKDMTDEELTAQTGRAEGPAGGRRDPG